MKSYTDLIIKLKKESVMSKTINYKEKYEKALERARVYWETDNDNTLDIKAKGTMEYLFPELAESEDEKIIKEIIQSIKGSMIVIHKDKCLTWLEKVREDNKFLKSVKVGDILTKSPDGIFVNLGQSDRALEHHDTVESLTDFEKAFYGMCCDKNKPFTKECCKTLMELARKQLHSEWSKDDERLRKTSVAFLTDYAAKGYENAVECIDWINSIKQKIVV